MNERIKKLAEQAYALCGKHNNDYNGPAFTEAFAALIEAAARADEREACAKVCDELHRDWKWRAAESIRARGPT